MIVKDTTAVDGTTTTGYTTPVSHRRRAGLSYQIDWTGTGLTATIKLYASNKREPVLTTDADWVEQTDVTITGPTTSASGQASANIGNANFRWYRLKYTRSAGSGTFVTHAETNKA